ncbi:endospore germination permease [Paenibacillaceae bacterium WGS1546]|uniref:GerAB/ArcD/ProY family transporter n=1 Tax=Cohnella sp. WGS1546 TaxID=3366810 RepID=UPI00372D01D1
MRPMSGQISFRSFTILVIFFTIGTTILIAPSGLATVAGQDAWIASAIGIAANVAMVAGYALLGNRHADQSIVEFGETLLGKWIGKPAGLLFGLYCYLLAALMVGDLGYFLTTQTMVETPIESLQVLFVVVIVIAVKAGMDAYVRAADIFFPWFVLLFVVLFLTLLPKFDVRQLQPPVEYGFSPILEAAFSFFSLQELGVLLMLYPYVKKGKGRSRAFLSGTLIGGFVLVATTIGSIGVLSYVQVANHLFPTYVMAKNISIGQFLQRMEGLLMLIWILSIFVKVTLTFHASVLGISQIFRLDERALVWPFAIGMVVLSLMCYTNAVYVQNFLATIWSPFTSTFMVAYPALLLLLSYVRNFREPASVRRTEKK